LWLLHLFRLLHLLHLLQISDCVLDSPKERWAVCITSGNDGDENKITTNAMASQQQRFLARHQRNFSNHENENHKIHTSTQPQDFNITATHAVTNTAGTTPKHDVRNSNRGDHGNLRQETTTWRTTTTKRTRTTVTISTTTKTSQQLHQQWEKPNDNNNNDNNNDDNNNNYITTRISFATPYDCHPQDFEQSPTRTGRCLSRYIWSPDDIQQHSKVKCVALSLCPGRVKFVIAFDECKLEFVWTSHCVWGRSFGERAREKRPKWKYWFGNRKWGGK